jgi:hypothetical protein
MTRAEATRMFADEQAKGRTRIVDPDLDAIPAVSPAQRTRNYSAPSHPLPPAASTFGMHRDHYRSPISQSVHPTTTSSRNRTSDSNPSPILLSDRHAPIVSGTSHSTPATWPSNPRSALDISPSMRRFQIIQAALEQESGSIPARSHGQVRPVDRTPFLSNTNPSNSQSLTPVPGRSSSSRTCGVQRAATASPDIFRGPKTYSPGPSSAGSSRNRESASTSVGFDARAPLVRGYSSHTNTYTHSKPDRTTGARASNPTAESTSEPSSSSRGLQRTLPHTPATFDSRPAASDSLGRSSASPRAVIRTPDWLPPYPTTRTPSPDFSSGTRPPSPASDELLSPLSNVNLNSFALDTPPRRGSNTVERNTPNVSVNSSARHTKPRGLNTQSQSPTRFYQWDTSPIALY